MMYILYTFSARIYQMTAIYLGQTKREKFLSSNRSSCPGRDGDPIFFSQGLGACFFLLIVKDPLKNRRQKLKNFILKKWKFMK